MPICHIPDYNIKWRIHLQFKESETYNAVVQLSLDSFTVVRRQLDEAHALLQVSQHSKHPLEARLKLRRILELAEFIADILQRNLKQQQQQQQRPKLRAQSFIQFRLSIIWLVPFNY